MLLSRNKKNNVYPYKPHFYYIKVGFKGSKLYRHVLLSVSEDRSYVNLTLETASSKLLMRQSLSLPGEFYLCHSWAFFFFSNHVLVSVWGTLGIANR